MDIVAILEIIKLIGGALATIITLSAVITLLVKPMREKVANWVTKTANTNKFEQKFDDINNKIDQLTELVTKTVEQNQKLQDDMDIQSNALQASLRNSILNACNKCIAKDSRSMFETQNIEEMFEKYEKLKGNGLVHLKIEKVRALKEDD